MGSRIGFALCKAQLARSAVPKVLRAQAIAIQRSCPLLSSLVLQKNTSTPFSMESLWREKAEDLYQQGAIDLWGEEVATTKLVPAIRRIRSKLGKALLLSGPSEALRL